MWVGALADPDGLGRGGEVVAATTGEVLMAEGGWDDVGGESMDDGVVGDPGVGKLVLCTA
jgi:hypothetical protein